MYFNGIKIVAFDAKILEFVFIILQQRIILEIVVQGIFRVDNEVGDNVEIMISDVMSYLPAMHYMLALMKKKI